MRRRVRAERTRANDLEAEQRTVHTNLTVPRCLKRVLAREIFQRVMADYRARHAADVAA